MFQWAPLRTGEIRPSGVSNRTPSPWRFNGLPFVQGRSGCCGLRGTDSVASRFNGLPFVQGRSEEPNDGVRGAQVVSMGSPSYRGDQQKVGLDRLGSRGWFQWAPLRTGEIRWCRGVTTEDHVVVSMGSPSYRGDQTVTGSVRPSEVVVSMGSPSYRGDQTTKAGDHVVRGLFQWAPLRTGEISRM